MCSIAINEMIAFLEAKKMSFDFVGNPADKIEGFSNLKDLDASAMVWIKDETYFNDELKARITPEKGLLVVAPFPIEGINCLVVDYPKGVFFSLLNHFFAERVEPSIAKDSCILTDDIGDDVAIGSNCYIGENVSIGSRTVIYPGVSIVCPCTIGTDCVIYPGVVIGADGFGYYVDQEGVPHRETHHRGVVIGDRVEIGANTCIDRGLLTDTVIEDDVKIDNLCQIAHNAIIRKNTMIVASSVICGSAELGEGAYVAPNSAIIQRVRLGDKARVGMGSVVLRGIKEGQEVFGNPARIIGGKSK